MRIPSLHPLATDRVGWCRPSWARPNSIVSGCLLLLLIASPVYAVNRVLMIAAPVLAVADSKITISVFASTNAGGGEQIGFFHVEYSTDGGKTWTGFCYAENAGISAIRTASLKTGPAGSKTLLRVRIAYRGGAAGDVDFNGTTINWADSWGKWREPPAKISTTTIVAP